MNILDGVTATAAELNKLDGAGTLYHTTNKPGVSDIDATGTADSTTFLRGDGSWQTVTEPAAATTTTAGIVERATETEARAFTNLDDSRYITPKTSLDQLQSRFTYSSGVLTIDLTE